MVMFTMILIIVVHEHMRNSAQTSRNWNSKKRGNWIIVIGALKTRKQVVRHGLASTLGNHRNPEQPIERLSDDEILVKKKVRVADTFNEYFNSIGEELAAGVVEISEISWIPRIVQEHQECVCRNFFLRIFRLWRVLGVYSD
jgi:hypothetical protein